MSAKKIEIKALLSTDDYVAYEAERSAADVKTSPLIRDFLKRWTAEQKHKRTRQLTEWPDHGQNMAMSLPGRPAPRELHLQYCGN